MISILQTQNKVIIPSSLEKLDSCSNNQACNDFFWISLSRPSQDEVDLIEKKFDLEIPKQDDMQDLELSENLYILNSKLYMTAQMLSGIDEHKPQNQAISFIITGNVIVSVSYIDFKTITALRATQSAELSTESIDGVLLYIIEAMVGRLAGLLNIIGRKTDQLSHSIFRGNDITEEQLDFTKVLKNIGNSNDIISSISECLTSFYRLLSFARRHGSINQYPDLSKDLDTLSLDISALTEQINFESNKLMFMLDTTLGLISIDQNRIIKIFSVLAVIFMPPTMVASMYGMNFTNMPELSWSFGYPLAILIMLTSAIGTYSYFKYRKWL